MIDSTLLLDEGFKALDKGDYSAALSFFTPYTSENLAPAASFNIQYGLALCYFGLHRQSLDMAVLDAAITHGEQAAAVCERRYDLQLLLGQCYAAQYQLTQDSSFKEKAQHAYQRSRECLPPTLEVEERSTLETRIIELITVLGDN